MVTGNVAQVVELAQVDASMLGLVGGKAAGLGELIGAGFRVPGGFCVTTRAHATGELPEREVLDAYARLGGDRVAVRSSATAEDLADASFAGQQDTFLNVSGEQELLSAIRRCWDSLHSERAVAYREANGFDGDVRMAVVVQRMVDAKVAGVLFTANPLTGTRSEMVVDAAPGLGDVVVDGSVIADHYVLDGTAPRTDGCLDRDQLDALREAGSRVQESFGAPQDVEWAIDQDGELWLLQSRAVTTLFPLPPQTDDLRAYFEMGHMQGMTRPFTPAGMSAMTHGAKLWMDSAGLSGGAFGDAMGIVPIGGRLFMDFSDLLRNKRFRSRMPQMMEVYGPRNVEIVQRLLTDPRFAPTTGGLPFPVGPLLKKSLVVVPKAKFELIRTLAFPDAARDRAFRTTEKLRHQAQAPEFADSAQRLRFAEEVQRDFMTASEVIWPLFVGIIVGQVPKSLLKGIATSSELDTVLGGLPHNVTTEMDLALWRLTTRLGQAERELLSSTPPAELTARYQAGELRDIGLDDFLARYGHRAPAEVDVGVARWAEEPTQIFATIAGYLRITDPEQAPDRRFEQAAARAEAAIDELFERARRKRPVRAHLARFCMRRARRLTGLRELGKFAWLYSLQSMRQQLLLIGEDLSGRGLLEQAGDVMFLNLDEIRAAVGGKDQRALASERKALHNREVRRRVVPIAVLSDGTDLEATAPAEAAADGAMTGLGAAPGKVTGPARVVHDPSDARIEPGEILVATSTDPGWTPLFMTAAGLVTETGSPMAHGPTVAREYGIPAVICVRNATTEITTGQVITVDATAGTVTPG
ncbi:PEP/pyruvate-binding domain-containing protein [Saccharopolyspora mangrovi]|uniref:PEP/pyruvate-binding domain-containing protein n=1 Tax=Saccharopolyspora mangrovi TaxID=3082379 RepID=A0ABU6A8L8_9PSEU|nr:PEP/pyruvate-binding domain-containing protein [Saccharopolyspora sp. S2-29]MEB3367725.1 PEP/pyruvate-binding domain-containing protein [Saccharopolyspora sp. S2-29]